MRTQALLLFLLLAAPACKTPLFDTPSREGRIPGRSTGEPVAAPDTSAFYATAVVFPDTVDWRRGDTRGAKIVLWRGEKPFGAVAAEESADPLRHRYQDGHLWTDAWDGIRTTVSCDGEPVFHYYNEESMAGFLVADGTVHTLGQRPGGGFTYRVNGEIVFSSPTGTVLGNALDPDREGGALSRDSTGVYYSYGLPVQLPDGLVWEYRVMRGGGTALMLPAILGGEMYDIRVQDGKVYRLEERYGSMCLVQEDDVWPISLPEDARSPRLVWQDGEMRVRASDRQGTRYWIVGVDGICDEFEITVPPDYRLQTQRCMARRDGTVALALTHKKTDEHLLVAGGEEHPVRFNGYFTGIYLKDK